MPAVLPTAKPSHSRTRAWAVPASLTLLVGMLCAPGVLRAQQMAMTSSSADLFAALPAAPEPQSNGQAVTSYEHKDQPNNDQPKRILGIVPNFLSVSTTERLPPQSVKDKFVAATEDSFDYSSLVFPIVIAGFNLGENKDPEFGTGAVGFGRYFWHSATDQTIENYMVEFAVPTLAHEDTRYYTLGHGGFLKRAGYSLSRVVITRSDDDKRVFNFGEVVGAGCGAGLSNLYYPSRERSFGNTGSQWGLNVGIDAGVFMFKEFWPDINHYVFHGKQPFQTVGAQHE